MHWSRPLTLSIASTTFALLVASPAAGAVVRVPPQWIVDGVEAKPGVAVADLDHAHMLLNGEIAAGARARVHVVDINFSETPGAPAGGVFNGDVAFPMLGAAPTVDYALDATGRLKIPAAGAYTFGVSANGGFRLQIGNFATEAAPAAGARQTLATFVFAKAGLYPVELTYYQHAGNAAELELFATPGTFTGVKQSGAAFRLVGDVNNGGIPMAESSGTIAVGGSPTPEPAAAGLLMVASLSLLKRRRV